MVLVLQWEEIFETPSSIFSFPIVRVNKKGSKGTRKERKKIFSTFKHPKQLKVIFSKRKYYLNSSESFKSYFFIFVLKMDLSKRLNASYSIDWISHLSKKLPSALHLLLLLFFQVRLIFPLSFVCEFDLYA